MNRLLTDGGTKSNNLIELNSIEAKLIVSCGNGVTSVMVNCMLLLPPLDAMHR